MCCNVNLLHSFLKYELIYAYVRHGMGVQTMQCGYLHLAWSIRTPLCTGKWPGMLLKATFSDSLEVVLVSSIPTG